MPITVQLDVQGHTAEPKYFKSWQEAKSYLIRDCWALQPGSVWVDEQELQMDFDAYYEVYAPTISQITALGGYYV